MAVIKGKNKTRHQASAANPLQALTAAALVLPGMMLGAAHAAEDEFTFQYGRYEESHRDLGNVKSQFEPISVDSLQAGSNVTLADRVKFAFNYVQDTWAGATPITTAPSVRQGNQPFSNGTAGASPYIQSGNGAPVYFDKQLKPLQTQYDDDTGEILSLGIDRQLAHTLVSASPETRKEGNFKLSYEWDEAAVDVGGGISYERDYESRFGNLGGRWDFNQKLTSLNGGVSYTNSDTSARMDHDASPYIFDLFPGPKIESAPNIKTTTDGTGGKIVTGNREDWAFNLGLTQILNKDALVKFGAGYTRSTGFMENPYKVVTVFRLKNSTDPAVDPFIPYTSTINAYLEQRPDIRNQWNLSTGFVQYVEPLDAALHLDYRFFHDDWGINAHTFEADWVQPLGGGWTVTPSARYYTQDAADFYTPYLTVFDFKDRPADYSSDHRLSGYGTLSGGLILSKEFSKGIRLDTGFQYYAHEGSFKLGSGGEGDYADFSYYMANAALNVNLAALGGGTGEHSHHAMHHNHGAPLPAGVMFGHVMTTPGDMMVGYRYMYSRQDGDMLHGTEHVSDQTLISDGCSDHGVTCRTAPSYMNMHMHMLDIMYAPTSWLNLMLMPQFMDMDMNVRGLPGVTPAPNAVADHLHGGHATGGVGDTGMYAMFKLFKGAGHNINMGLGVTAPTGDVDIKLRRMHGQGDDTGTHNGFIHYGMQLGSGTWDFKPSLTYTGQVNDWSWGAQTSGTKRLEDSNQSGFAFGDVFQSTAWGSYSVFNWLSASVRGIYTVQGAVKGSFNPISGRCSLNHGNDRVPCSDINPKEGTMDQPKNYGGRYWDVGLGLNVTIPSGTLAGNSLSVEWLQPVEDDVNGYQLERNGTLNATWSYGF